MRAEPLAPSEWSAVAGTFNDLSYRQCASYVTHAAAATKSQVEFLRLTDGQSICGAAAVRVNKIAGLPLGIAYVHHGPLSIRKGGRIEIGLFMDCVLALKSRYVADRGLTLRIVPPYSTSAEASGIEYELRRIGFRKTNIASRTTILFDTMHDETKARQNLKKKWRYTLRQAQKEGVAIELANSQDGFCAAATLLNELETKKGFVSPLGARFFWEVFKDARESEAYRLHVARAGEEIVAVHLGSYVGETSVYLIGASNEAARRLNASYLLHWRAVQETIARGMRWYDLGGIDPRSNPSGYQFKKGMNGIEIAEIGAFDCSPDFLRGKSVELLESLARSLRGRMRAAGMSRRDGAATA